MTVKEIISESRRLSISVSEYIERIPANSFLLTNELIKEIEFARYNKDDNFLEKLLIIASRDGLDSRYTIVLCAILEEDWHYSQEDIAMALEEIKDPASIQSLYRRAISVPDYDDGRSLARKCIWALGKINTPEAKMKLNLLKDFPDSIISEVASLELTHLRH